MAEEPAFIAEFSMPLPMEPAAASAMRDMGYTDAHNPWVSRAAFWAVGLAASVTPLMAPLILEVVARHFGLTPQDAGRFATAELAGTAIGAFSVSFAMHRLSPRMGVLVAGVVALAMHLLSIVTSDFNLFIAVRFIVGITSGCLLAFGSAAIGGTRAPERNFACLTAIAYLMSAAGLRLLPALAAQIGIAAIYGFTALLASSVILASFAFPKQARNVGKETARKTGGMGSATIFAAMAMLALFFAMGGVWPFMGQLGQQFGAGAERTATILAAGALGSWSASLVAIVLGNRLGRLIPIIIGGLGMAAVLAWLLAAQTAAAFAPAAVIFCFTLNLAAPYLMAAVAALDRSGRLIAFTIALQDVALAAGPLAASLLIPWGGLPSVLLTGIAGGLLTPLLLFAASRRAAIG